MSGPRDTLEGLREIQKTHGPNYWLERTGGEPGTGEPGTVTYCFRVTGGEPGTVTYCFRVTRG
jgi:hypothetical protein